MPGIGPGTVIEDLTWEEVPAVPGGDPQAIVTAHVRPHRRRAPRSRL